MAKSPSKVEPTTGETDASQPDANTPPVTEAPPEDATPPPVRAYGVLTRRRGELIDGQIVFVEGADAAAAAEVLAALEDLVIPATDAQVAAAGHFLFPLPPA